MQLFVVRHAIAKDRAPDQEDASRELTRAGTRRFKQVVRGLRALDLRFTRVLTSPWSRAIATGKLLRGCEPIVTPLLIQPPRAELLTMLGEGTADARTAVVGHQPWLGQLIAWLAFGDMKHGDAIALKKGAVVCLDGTPLPGGMTLQSILPPRVLRAVR